MNSTRTQTSGARSVRPQRGTRGAASHAQATSSPAVTGFDANTLWLLLSFIAVTLFAYYPAWQGGMLWDDDGHVTPPQLRSLVGLSRIWFEVGASQQYYPILHSAFWVLHRLFGDDTLGYHLVTICLHATSAWMLVLILRRLKIAGATLAGLIFALHPVNVESVAWISEMKNTLSGVFYFSAALAYLRFDETRRTRHYLIAVSAFALALLSKSVTATLPVGLLAVLWWRRGSLRMRDDVAPLIPFVMVGAAAGMFTAWVERTHIGAGGVGFDLSLVDRALVAGRAVWFYAAKLIWPTNLTFMYPRWQIDAHAAWQYLFPLGVLAVMAGLWLTRQRSRAPLAAAVFYGVTLAPALGFVDAFPFRYSFVADHFQYLAAVGPMALFCAAMAVVVNRPQAVSRDIQRGLSLILVAILGAATWTQAHGYVDSDTLYRTTIQRNPSAWLAHNNLAFDLMKRGRAQEALVEFEAAVAINPMALEAQQNLGALLMEAGRSAEAIPHFEKSLSISPNYPTAVFAMGKALANTGQFNPAITYFTRTLALQPDYPEAHVHLGAALEALGQVDAAMKEYATGVAAEPDSPFAHYRYGDLLRRTGRLPEAIREYREVMKREPTSAGVQNALALTLAQSGQFDEAIVEFKAAIRLMPGEPKLHENLARAQFAAGRKDEAEASAREAQRLLASRRNR